MEYNVKIYWDKEASVWIATSDNIPGLVLESDNMQTLYKKLELAIPEILEVNNMPPATNIKIYAVERQQVLA